MCQPGVTVLSGKTHSFLRADLSVRALFHPDCKQGWWGSRACILLHLPQLLCSWALWAYPPTLHTGRSSFGLDLDFKVLSLFSRNLCLPPYVCYVWRWLSAAVELGLVASWKQDFEAFFHPFPLQHPLFSWQEWLREAEVITTHTNISQVRSKLAFSNIIFACYQQNDLPA